MSAFRSIKVSLAIAGLCASLASACAGDKQTQNAGSLFQDPVSIADAVQYDQRRPALWRVSDSDTTLYLFGALHLLPPALEWRSTAYDQAMARATITITEADTKSASAIEAITTAVQRYGLNPPGVTLSETIGDKRTKKLRAVAEQLSVPMAALEPMRPWLATLTLTQRAFQNLGFDESAGVEAAVLSQAAMEGDAIAHLETAAFQIETLASLTGEDILADFDSSLDQLKDFQQITERMVIAWRTGDEKALEKDILTPLRKASPAAYAIIFDQRNANWVTQIDGLMDGDGDYFMAVGAGHLIGENGVVDLLKKRGYRIERVQ